MVSKPTMSGGNLRLPLPAPRPRGDAQDPLSEEHLRRGPYHRDGRVCQETCRDRNLTGRSFTQRRDHPRWTTEVNPPSVPLAARRPTRPKSVTPGRAHATRPSGLLRLNDKKNRHRRIKKQRHFGCNGRREATLPETVWDLEVEMGHGFRQRSQTGKGGNWHESCGGQAWAWARGACAPHAGNHGEAERRRLRERA